MRLAIIECKSQLRRFKMMRSVQVVMLSKTTACDCESEEPSIQMDVSECILENEAVLMMVWKIAVASLTRPYFDPVIICRNFMIL